MFGIAEDVINCLANDTTIEHHLIIDLIRHDDELKAMFKDTVEDFSNYEELLEMVGGQF